MTANERAAPYDRHVGRYGAELADGLLRFAAIGDEQRILDVGCGTGVLTRAVAQVVGVNNVAGVDISGPALETCRARVPGADIRLAGAEDLPFGDGEFDAVLAQLVVTLVDDSAAAVREMARVARSGGIVAAAVWHSDEMPLLRSYWEAAAAIAPEKLEGIDEGAQIGVNDPDVLRELWIDAGLDEVTIGEIDATADYEDFDDLWFAFAAGVGFSGRLYTSLDSSRRDALRADAYERLGSPQGSFRLTARAWTISGRKTRSGRDQTS
jgi:SAM-dependent methyltransferase